ncbi:MAG: hypothetical protein H8F28_24070 [Fibrella sp.]|nr:hypothetical protein [Armatimonadota bacterium]
MKTSNLTSSSETIGIVPSGEMNVASTGSNSLLSNVVAAHGGEAFLSIRSLTVVGTGQFFTPPQIGRLKIALDSFTLYTASGGRSRLEAKSVFGALVFVIRGEDKGGLVVMGGRKQELPAEHMSGLEPMEFLRMAFNNNYAVTELPENTGDSAPDNGAERCYEIRSLSGEVTCLFVDAETKLMRKLVSNRSRGEMTVSLADYQPVAGALIPGDLRLLENGEEVFHLVGKEITPNDVLNDKLFQTP